MRSLRTTCLPFLSCAALAVAQAGCGGTDQQPAYPDPSVVDRSADDLDLPEPDADAAGEDGEPSDEEGSDAELGASAPIRVIAGERTPIEGASPTLRIVAPRAGQLVRTGNVSLRLRLTNWPLAPEPGQHVHVIVDDEPYIAVRDVSAPIDLNRLVQENLGHELAEGTHVVRVFPSRGHHESVKTDGAFAMAVFHYRSQTEGFSLDANAPLLTYSRPKGCNPAGERVLLDFYLSNVELAADGHRVRYAIDDEVRGDITSWAPHFIEGLPAMSHTVQLQLVNAEGEVVPGPFNDTRRTIQVRESCE